MMKDPKRDVNCVIYLSRRVILTTYFVSIAVAFLAGNFYYYHAPFKTQTKFSKNDSSCTKHGDCSVEDVEANFYFSSNTKEVSQNSIIDHINLETENSQSEILSHKKEKNNNEERPALGQNLIVSMGHVDQSFLDSENVLVQLMMAIVNDLKIQSFSYHCHNRIKPDGITCTGIAFGSYITIRTNISGKIMMLSLFTRNDTKNVESFVMPLIKSVFELPNNNPNQTAALIDSNTFSRIDASDNEQAKNKNKITQYYDDDVYYEALVHPTLMSHDKPEKVAIIGKVRRGDSSTLKEVLKHKYVTSVHIVDVENISRNADKEIVLEWSDCSDLVGVADKCEEDDKVEIVQNDGAMSWASAQVYRMNQDHDESYREDPYDVLIIDAFNYVEELYLNEAFIETLYNCLNDYGLIVFHLGKVSNVLNSKNDDSSTTSSKMTLFMDLLENVGFQSVHMYTESHLKSPGKFYPSIKSIRRFLFS